MNSKLSAVVCAAILTLIFDRATAQSPSPVVATPVTASVDAIDVSMQATLKSLRDTKAANEEILKKQQATLEALDELQKAADQIKIFSKRG
jgi:hypothetical protein